jgi:predicted enzyme related to lactoylglutathione lyase
MFEKLRTIIYHVNNPEKVKEWYKKITGISSYFDETFYVGFNIDGYKLGLDPDLNNANNGEHPIAYWQVDDIKDAVNNLGNNGAKIINPIQQVGGGISVTVAEDPFGNYIGLIEEKIIE